MACRFRIGEAFFHITPEEATTLLEKEEQKITSQLDKMEEEEKAMKKTMENLKVQLYQKFKSTINLEEDE